MCDISHLSHHHQQQQKTTSTEPMVWYWYLWSQEEQGWMIQKPTFVFGNAWKISLALSSWLEFLAKTDRMINCVLVLPWSASTIWLWCLSFTSVFGGVMGNISVFSKKSLGICKLPTLRLETGLNSPTFKVRHKFAGNLSTHILFCSHSLTPALITKCVFTRKSIWLQIGKNLSKRGKEV